MDKRALVVGIDSYDISTGLSALSGAARDAREIAALLKTHGDGSEDLNWYVTPLVEGVDGPVTRRQLVDAVNEFFYVPEDHRDALAETDLLLYFSGHAVRSGGVTELVASDDAAISFDVIMSRIQYARANSVTVILDCCTSGALGAQSHPDPFLPEQNLVLHNVTILTASRSGEDALEHPDRGGLFSEAIRGGLEGAAADLLGNVTALSLYAHASGAFGDGDQRPTFKSHAVQPRVLRRVEPQVPFASLVEITSIFDPVSRHIPLTKDHEGDPADPAYTDRHDVNRQPFTGTTLQIELDHLKAFRDAQLVRSDDGRDFWFLCEEVDPAKSTVSLTALGRYFWDVVKAGRLETVADTAATGDATPA